MANGSWGGLNDGTQILLVLAILYFLECVAWLRGDAARFLCGFLSQWSDHPPGSPRGVGWRGSVGSPLPWSESFLADPLPVVFDEAVLLVPGFEGPSPTGVYQVCSLDDLQPIRSAERLILSGETTLAAFSTAAGAVFAAQELERLRSAAAGERQVVASQILDRIWSVPSARRQLKEWREDSSRARFLGGILAVIAFGVGPVVLWQRGILAGGSVLALTTAFAVVWAFAALAGVTIPGRAIPPGSGGLLHRMLAFVSPVAAMRLYDSIGRQVLVGYEPAVVAIVTASDNAPDSAAACWLRASMFPVHDPVVPPEEAPGVRALEWYSAQRGLRVLAAVNEFGLSRDALFRPIAQEFDAKSYCPRCFRQFTRVSTFCGICGIAATPWVGTANVSDS